RVVVLRRGQLLRWAGGGQEGVEARPAEAAVRQVEATLEELARVHGVAEGIGLVVRQPRPARLRSGVRRRAGRVTERCRRGGAIDTGSHRRRIDAAAGAAGPAIGGDRRDVAALGERRDDKDVAVLMMAGKRAAGARAAGAALQEPEAHV